MLPAMPNRRVHMIKSAHATEQGTYNSRSARIYMYKVFQPGFILANIMAIFRLELLTFLKAVFTEFAVLQGASVR